MTKTRIQEEYTELDNVISFRMFWLLSAGWTEQNAEILANEIDIDWHRAEELRKKMDDEDVLMRILL